MGGGSSIAIAQAYPPAQTHKRSPCKSCPLDKVWLNGNCPSDMRTHSAVSLSALYARACPSLLSPPTQRRPTRSSTNPPSLPLSRSAALNEKECLLCTVKAQPVPPIICVCVCLGPVEGRWGAEACRLCPRASVLNLN